ncbi:tyrosine-type recombinase/integrase [Oscillibacter sp.]|uniref:tyrosine-type recombinase/integrase n=1 Tax=Oscillibacter sp. TaxID=1945593 RepID=UPI003397755F
MKPQSQQFSLNQIVAMLEDHPEIKITLTNSVQKSELFEVWATYWLDTWKKGQVKDNTFNGTYYASVNNHLIPYFKNKYLSDITPSDIQEFFNSMSTKYSLETLKKYRSCLKGIFTTAVENNLCSQSPLVSSLRLTSHVSPIIKIAWTKKQYDIAFEYARHAANGLMIMVLMETGISRSELLGLTWEDFDYHGRCLQIRNGLVECDSLESHSWQLVHDGLKNEYRIRTIPISSELAIRMMCKSRFVNIDGKNIYANYIFHSPTGKAFVPHNWYNRAFRPFMDELHSTFPSIPVLTPHELRHTRASVLHEMGVSLYDIQQLLGHRDLTMLAQRYLHTNPELLRDSLHL